MVGNTIAVLVVIAAAVIGIHLRRYSLRDIAEPSTKHWTKGGELSTVCDVPACLEHLLKNVKTTRVAIAKRVAYNIVNVGPALGVGFFSLQVSVALITKVAAHQNNLALSLYGVSLILSAGVVVAVTIIDIAIPSEITEAQYVMGRRVPKYYGSIRTHWLLALSTALGCLPGFALLWILFAVGVSG